MNLGKFHWGMWDLMRTPGESSDHRALRPHNHLPWDHPSVAHATKPIARDMEPIYVGPDAVRKARPLLERIQDEWYAKNQGKAGRPFSHYRQGLTPDRPEDPKPATWQPNAKTIKFGNVPSWLTQLPDGSWAPKDESLAPYDTVWPDVRASGWYGPEDQPSPHGGPANTSDTVCPQCNHRVVGGAEGEACKNCGRVGQESDERPVCGYYDPEREDMARLTSAEEKCDDCAKLDGDGDCNNCGGGQYAPGREKYGWSDPNLISPGFRKQQPHAWDAAEPGSNVCPMCGEQMIGKHGRNYCPVTKKFITSRTAAGEPQIDIAKYMEEAQNNMSGAQALIHHDLMTQYGWESQHAWTVAGEMVHNWIRAQENFAPEGWEAPHDDPAGVSREHDPNQPGHTDMTQYDWSDKGPEQCPNCYSNALRLNATGQDGQRMYECGICHHQFLEDSGDGTLHPMGQNPQHQMNGMPQFPEPTGETAPNSIPWSEAEQEYYRSHPGQPLSKVAAETWQPGDRAMWFGDKPCTVVGPGVGGRIKVQMDESEDEQRPDYLVRHVDPEYLTRADSGLPEFPEPTGETVPNDLSGWSDAQQDYYRRAKFKADVAAWSDRIQIPTEWE